MKELTIKAFCLVFVWWLGLLFLMAATANVQAQAIDPTIIWSTETSTQTFNYALGQIWRVAQDEQKELSGLIGCKDGSWDYETLIMTHTGSHKRVEYDGRHLGKGVLGEGWICGMWHVHPYSIQDLGPKQYTYGNSLLGFSPKDFKLIEDHPGYDHLVIDKNGKSIVTHDKQFLSCEWNAFRTSMPSCERFDISSLN